VQQLALPPQQPPHQIEDVPPDRSPISKEFAKDSASNAGCLHHGGTSTPVTYLAVLAGSAG
jgi:hypothetical protein